MENMKKVATKFGESCRLCTVKKIEAKKSRFCPKNGRSVINLLNPYNHTSLRSEGVTVNFDFITKKK